jgi:CheY-like chemotaxis protein
MEVIFRGTILHVEDDVEWQEKVKAVAEEIGGVRVDFASTFREAMEFLNAKRYDVCILDSRLENRRARIHTLLRKVRSCSGLSPLTVALTGFSGDISKRDRNEVYAVLDKALVDLHPPLLKQVILDAVNTCVRVQSILLRQPEKGEKPGAISRTGTEFDVFLAHNSKDSNEVEKVFRELKSRALKGWFDRDQIPPGRPVQDETQQAILKCKSAAIFIGPAGLGKWEVMELRTFISQCVERNIPVIPVFLPSVKQVPQELLFLRELNWVRFIDSIEDKEALDNLEWGITGIHPKDRTSDKE